MDPEIRVEVSILIAALGGLAVGLERQWSGHASGPRARFAGIRTFALLGMVSGLAGGLWMQGFQAMAGILVFGAVALIVAAYIAAAAAQRDLDGTTEVAALVVVAAGITSGIGHWALAGGIIAITTLLLVEKSRIHEIAQRLDDAALRAAVRFGVMAIVILPLLPEGPFGPWGGLRPRTLWLAVLMFSGLSFAGYLARLALPASGYLVAGILGGVISSTGVTFSFSRLSRSESKQSGLLGLGVLGASTVLFLRVLLTTAVLNADLARTVAPYFALPFLVGCAMTAAGIRRNRGAEKSKTSLSNPLQFWTSLQMAALFQIVFYLVFWLGQTWGTKGLLVSGALLGLTDVDALTISMARGGHGAAWEVAGQALSIGILSNTALKAAVAIALGKGAFRWVASSGLVAIGVALALSLLVFR